MKKTPYVAAVLLVLLPMVAGLLLWTPLGHHAERAGTRLARVVRSATDPIYPRPLVLLRIWRGPGEPAFRTEVYKSGSLIVYSNGRTERQLTRDTVDRLVEIAGTALGDFSAHGCDTAPDGINADLYVLVNGGWRGTSCRRSSDWPTGEHTRRLLAEIRSLLPGGLEIPTGPHDEHPTGPSP